MVFLEMAVVKPYTDILSGCFPELKKNVMGQPRVSPFTLLHFRAQGPRCERSSWTASSTLHLYREDLLQALWCCCFHVSSYEHLCERMFHWCSVGSAFLVSGQPLPTRLKVLFLSHSHSSPLPPLPQSRRN